MIQVPPKTPIWPVPAANRLVSRIKTLSLIWVFFPFCSFAQSAGTDPIPFPENELSFSAYLIDRYSKTYCDDIQAAIDKSNEITRSDLYSIAWNDICSPWIKRDGYREQGQALDYYFMKLQSISYADCQWLRDHFYLIFDAGHATNDVLIEQHRRMINILATLENNTDVSQFNKVDPKLISAFQHTLRQFSPFLFFNIHHSQDSTYTISYYYFNPGGPYSYPMDGQNHVMDITISIEANTLNQFDLNTDFKRFKWLSMHIDALKEMVDIEPPPGPPPATRN